LGIKKAMEYNPKWIVLSNDDMYKIDDVDVLVKALNDFNPEKIDCVFTDESLYHSMIFSVGKPRMYTNILRLIFKHREHKFISKITRRYELEYNRVAFKSEFLRRLFFNSVFSFIYTCDFGIFSDIFIKKMEILCSTKHI